MYAVPSDHPPGVIGICTGELARFSAWANCVAGLQVPPGSIPSWQVGPLIGASIEKIFQYVMDHEQLQWVWLMGDDHTFPRDIILKLLDRQKDVVLPLCLNRGLPIEPTILNTARNTSTFLEELPPGGMKPLAPHEVSGDAGMLIRRRVLEKVGPPWYERLVSGALGGSEDRYFCQKLKDAGFTVWVDCDNPIGHIGVVTYIPVLTETGWKIRLMDSACRTVVDMVPQRRFNLAPPLDGHSSGPA